MANIAALLFEELPDVNWAGFYLLKGQDLVLGPFQGKPACTRIGPGKGVCGAAVTTRETVVVENVNEFPGHIACDARSKSEIVVPLISAGQLLGVLDVDSGNALASTIQKTVPRLRGNRCRLLLEGSSTGVPGVLTTCGCTKV